MQRSQELLDAYLDMMRGIEEGSITSITDILSSSDAVSMVGVREHQWKEREQFVPPVDADWARFRQLGTRVENHAEAWAEGGIGLVVDMGRLTLRSCESIPLRWTTILRREDGAWKAIHQHASIGIETDQEVLKAFGDAMEAAVAAAPA